MKYRIYYVDVPYEVDEYLKNNFGMNYNEVRYHPDKDYAYSCSTVDEEQMLILRLKFNDIELHPVNE